MSPVTAAPAAEFVSIAGVELEVLRRGAGRPLLLAPRLPERRSAGAVPRAARRGTRRSSRRRIPASATRRARTTSTRSTTSSTSISTCSRRCRTSKVTLVGLSFGGWLAAEIAVKCGHRIDRLVLVDALGIKVSDRETPDILDVFNTSPAGGAAAELARSQPVGAGLRRDVGRGARRPRAQLGVALSLRVASVHVQPAAQALAAPHRRADARAVGRSDGSSSSPPTARRTAGRFPARASS